MFDKQDKELLKDMGTDLVDGISNWFAGVVRWLAGIFIVHILVGGAYVICATAIFK